MARKLKCYEVNVVFEGCMKYTVQAPDEEAAKIIADELFAVESPAVVQANVMQTIVKVDAEVNAI